MEETAETLTHRNCSICVGSTGRADEKGRLPEPPGETARRGSFSKHGLQWAVSIGFGAGRQYKQG